MNIEWTHKGVKITDIRKVKQFYVISIADKKITSPLFVTHNIFDARVNSYYLRGFSGTTSNLGVGVNSREEVLDVTWNMVITKGYYIKLSGDSNEEKIWKDEDKFYISFLEIAGPLGDHVSN